MKPPPFEYHDPRTEAEVIALLSALDNAKLLAGGQSLMPMLNMRYVLPDHVIDLNRVEGLSYIREADGALLIGAMTRQRELEDSALVRRRCPLMHEAILQVGHRQTRNRGTIGGSLCHLDPAAELVAVALALDAVVTIAGPNGRRDAPFSAFPAGFMTPAIEAHELLVAVRLPIWLEGHGSAFMEMARRHGDFAKASAAALLEADAAGVITRAAVTLGGVTVTPTRMPDIEAGLIGEAPSDALLRELCESCRTLDAIDDIHASAAYRQHLAGVLTRRTLAAARDRMTGAGAKVH